MRQAEVYFNEEKAGTLTERDNRSFVFRYDDVYFSDPSKAAISLTLPKRQQQYEAEHLFPFFFNLISEGANLSLQSRYLKIDKRDAFGLLCETARYDSIGAVTVHLIS